MHIGVSVIGISAHYCRYQYQNRQKVLQSIITRVYACTMHARPQIDHAVTFFLKKMAKRKSPIWDYFSLGEDTKYGICKTCNEAIPRGGSSTKSYSPTNLVYHIKRNHSDMHDEYLAKVEAAKEAKDKESSTTMSTKKNL